MPSTFRPTFARVACVLLTLAAPLSALQSPLSDESVREAYFIGQRTDGAANGFFEAYRHYLPAPESGPHVEVIELWTPFAQVVDLSRRQGVGYSAQQAQRAYRMQGNLLRVGVHVRYTATYGPGWPYTSNKVPGATGTWKDFQVRFHLNGKLLDSQTLRYEGHRTGTGRYGSRATGFAIWLEYDPGDISSGDATVVVDTPEGQHVVTTFDLSMLR